MEAVTLSSFPSAVLHFDGDAFFTSVEQALHPQWRGRPLVTGRERGIIACASYEAKALGIRRGVALWEARRRCPDLVVLPSDYETYSLFSQRMFALARRYTPVVEEYSIDEGFADLTGLRRVHRCSYQDIARRFQQALHAQLGLTVSVGLSLTKGLAKLASDFRKPRGFTAVAGCHIHLLLQRISVGEVWGIGPNSAHLLRKHGVSTAAEFAARPEAWARRLLGKPGLEIHRELRGTAVHPVVPGAAAPRASISKFKTFAAPCGARDAVYARLVRNLESALIKARRHRLRARRIAVGLRRKDYAQQGLEARLTRAVAAAHDVLPVVREMFAALFRAGTEYRSTYVVLSELEEDRFRQPDLFEDPLRIERVRAAARVTDDINAHFGKHRLCLGTGLDLPRPDPRTRARDAQPWRKTHLLPGETARRRLALPRLALCV